MQVAYAEKEAWQIRQMLQGTAIAFDFECTSTDWWTAEIIGLALATLNDEYYFVVGDGGMSQAALARVLRGWFDDPNQKLIAHNASFDMQFLVNLGVYLSQPPYDTMGLAQLYNESAPLSLKDLAWLVLDRRPRKWDKTFLDWPTEEVISYGCADARNTYDLACWFLERLDESLWPYYYKYVLPLPKVAVAMERAGWYLECPAVEEYGKSLLSQIDVLKAEICADVPGLENPNSTKQLEDALTRLGAEWSEDELTKTGRKSTSEEVLKRMEQEENADVRAIANQILALRKLVKLQGYITGKKGLMASVASDGRIHPDWRIFGTFTGRWACASPNLQNIPKHREGDENEVNVRNWFVAAPGSTLVIADLSQAELRVLAGLSGDERLSHAYAEGRDVHRATAAAIFNKSFDKITDHERFIGKTVNFAMIYGAGPRRIASVTGLSESEAEEVMRRFARTHQDVMRWREKVKSKVQLDGVVYTAFGRPRRPLLLDVRRLAFEDTVEDQEVGIARLTQAGFEKELRKVGLTQWTLRTLPDFKLPRQLAYLEGRGYRQAVNAAIQGTVADIMNLGLVRLVNQGVKVIGQIHDEVICECPISQAGNVAQTVIEALTTKIGDVILTVDIKTTNRWGE